MVPFEPTNKFYVKLFFIEMFKIAWFCHFQAFLVKIKISVEDTNGTFSIYLFTRKIHLDYIITS